MSYEVGDVARLFVKFTDINLVPTDPSAVSIIIQSPDSIEVTFNTLPPIVHDSTGNYHYDLSIAEPGIYSYRWIGTGVIAAVQEGAVTVNATIFNGQRPSPIDLCTIQQAKAWMNQTGSCSFTDIDIQFLVTAVSAMWLWRTGFGPSDGSVPTQSIFTSRIAFNEWYDGNGNNRLFLRYSPIVSVQGLNISGVTIPASSSVNAPGYVIDQNGRSIVIRGGGGITGSRFAAYGAYSSSRFGPAYFFYNGTQNVNIQYTAGYVAVPPDITEAIKRIIALWWRKNKHIDLKQVAQPDSLGTMTYTDLELPVEVIPTLRFYSRRALI